MKGEITTHCTVCIHSKPMISLLSNIVLSINKSKGDSINREVLGRGVKGGMVKTKADWDQGLRWWRSVMFTRWQLPALWEKIFMCFIVTYTGGEQWWWSVPWWFCMWAVILIIKWAYYTCTVWAVSLCIVHSVLWRCCICTKQMIPGCFDRKKSSFNLYRLPYS